MSKTPRTDALYTGPCKLPITAKHRQHAELLELELSDALKQLSAANQLLAGFEERAKATRLMECLVASNANQDKVPDDGGPAFPVAIMSRQADGMPMTGCEFGVGGMSLRDWLSGMALPAVIEVLPASGKAAVAVHCVDYADQVIAALKGKVKK